MNRIRRCNQVRLAPMGTSQLETTLWHLFGRGGQNMDKRADTVDDLPGSSIGEKGVRAAG